MRTLTLPFKVLVLRLRSGAAQGLDRRMVAMTWRRPDGNEEGSS